MSIAKRITRLQKTRREFLEVLEQNIKRVMKPESKQLVRQLLDAHEAYLRVYDDEEVKRRFVGAQRALMLYIRELEDDRKYLDMLRGKTVCDASK